MGLLGLTQLAIALFLPIFIFVLCIWRWHRNSVLINWPLLGMLPGLFWNASAIHDFAASGLKQSGGTFEFKGPWFPKLDFLFTSDPSNIHHIFVKNFSNYPLGHEFKAILEPLGDGILNSDGESWKSLRKIIHSLLRSTRFELLYTSTIHRKIENDLLPILEQVSKQGMEVDMQDVFKRFMFDYMCSIMLGFDPNCLSLEFPDVSYENAFEDIEDVVLYRHIVPETLWKLQRWAQVGVEKKMTKAWDTFDQFLYERIRLKREELSKKESPVQDQEFDMLTYFVLLEKEEGQLGAFGKPDKFLRDTAFNLMAAGRDAVSAGLTWFLWLIATHPSVEKRIVEEIKQKLDKINDEGGRKFLSPQELNRLVYLHAAMCETLRLYPPIPFEHRRSIEPDNLPSGHHVKGNTRMLISIYAMGRMENIWGEDCLEFKPERWISEEGGIVHVPSHKFSPFIAGPRTCIGKDMAFLEMKTIASAVVYNYHVHVVEDHPVLPKVSIVLYLNHGLRVRLSKRCV